MGDLLGLQTYKALGKPGTIRGMILQVPVYTAYPILGQRIVW